MTNQRTLIIRNAWMQFRLGHTTYLSFTLQIINFVIITHALLLQQLGVRIEIWQFAIVMAAIYVPAAILIGRLHINKQYVVENKALYEKSQVWVKVQYIHTKMMNGTATEQERQELEGYLKSLIDKA